MSSTTSSRRSGFTLAELMIAIVLAGLFAIVLFNFVNSQARFTRVQSAREEVGQNLRGALEIIASELRAVPGGAITIAGTNQIRFMLPRVWGSYCGADGAGKHHVAFPVGSSAATRADAFPSDFTTAGGWGLAMEIAGTPGTYVNAAITDTGTVASPGTGTPCAARGVDFAQTFSPVVLQIGTGVFGAAPTTGTEAFVYHWVQYATATGTAGTRTPTTGTWLMRTSDYAGNVGQALAGPLGSGGLEFIYRCNGAPFVPAAGGDRRITEVLVIMSMQSRATTQAVLQTETDTITVHLRNSGTVTAC